MDIHKLLYVEMNVFALVILFLIFLNIHRGRTSSYLLEQKLFLALLYSNALILVLDSLMWIMDGGTGLYLRETYLFVTACYYAMNPIICMLWSFYADYLVYGSASRLRKLLIPMLIPAAINLILSFMSMFKNVLFFIDANNVYHRGTLFFVMAVISYAYLLYTLIKIISKHDRIQKQNFMPILVFAFPPFIGGIIQSFFYGVSILWICMTVSILIVFINIQTQQLRTDYLTGLFNRRQLDSYLHQLAQSNAKKGLLGGLMTDLNSFKMINDKFGHNAGDQALKDTAEILKNTFRKRDFIARYGGDEMMIIMEIESRADIDAAVNRLNENIKAFNAKAAAPYLISLSIGYDCYDFNAGITMQEFVKHIDTLMYLNKMSNEYDFEQGSSMLDDLRQA